MRWPLIRYLPSHTHIDFVRVAPIAAVISALLVIASGFFYFTEGLNLGIDFAGGAQLEVVTSGPAPLAKFRQSLARYGVEDPQVQGFGAPNSAMLRFKPPEGRDGRSEDLERAEVQRLHRAGRGRAADAALHLVPLSAAVRAGRGHRPVPRCHPDRRHAVGAADRVLDHLDRGAFDRHRLFDEREGDLLRPAAREPAQIQD